MELKEAVKKAKEYISDIFSEENVKNIGLEEIEFDERNNLWKITIGFHRPWQERENLLSSFEKKLFRDYKVVTVDNETGEVKSVKNRELENV